MVFVRLSLVIFMALFFCHSALAVNHRAVKPTAAQTTPGRVNVNTALGKDLVKLTGLTPSKARAIVAYRKKHGNFTSLDDLTRVKSISTLGAENIRKIQAQLTI